MSESPSSANADLHSRTFQQLEELRASLDARLVAAQSERHAYQRELDATKHQAAQRERSLLLTASADGRGTVAPDAESIRLAEHISQLVTNGIAASKTEALIRALLDEVKAEIGNRQLQTRQRIDEAIRAKLTGKWEKCKQAAILAMCEAMAALAVKETSAPETADARSMLTSPWGMGIELNAQYEKFCAELRAQARAEVLKNFPECG